MKKIFIMSLFSAIMSLMGCNAQNANFKSIDVAEFEKAIADTSVVRLDVRTAEEFAEGHISGAINIDVLEGSFESKALATLPKEKTIALYCRSGRRSKKAAAILADNGYNVVELSTGFNGWVAGSKEIVK